MTKRDTEAIIRDMWKCKHAHDKKNAAKGKPPEDIHDYIYLSAAAAHAGCNCSCSCWGRGKCLFI